VLWNLANAKILPESSLKSGDGAATLANDFCHQDCLHLHVSILELANA
jgi:hypothetical protein